MEENTQVVEEITQSQDIVETTSNIASAQPSDADRNFAALREAKQKAERERDEYMQKMRQYEEAMAKKNERSPDDIAEIRDIQQARQEMSAQIEEMKIRAAYPDIDKVVSKENIDRLKEADPELAQIIYEMPDQHKALKAAYKYIKKMGLSGEDFQKEKDALAANAAKPKSSSAVNKTTPLSQMNDFIENSDERRRRIYKEMVAASQNM